MGAIEAHAQQASENERPFFEDGTIEFAEYEEAVLSTVDCVNGRGFDMHVEMADDGLYQYVGVATADDALENALGACRELWSRRVELAFQETQAPTSDELPAVRARMQCLLDAGEAPTGGSRPDQLRASISQLAEDSPAKACGDLLP